MFPVPKFVFIVPYRDREKDYLVFSEKIKYILEDVPRADYAIHYVHQCDAREFNRGAMKNIGFMAMRDRYPSDYRDITFVFNDVDTLPLLKNTFDYETVPGTIKHFYGFTFTLGGIVSITGGDFEMLNGFVNLWAWGFEDNALNNRAVAAGLNIDRSVFFPIADKNVESTTDSYYRTVNHGEFMRFYRRSQEGISNIDKLSYVINDFTGFIDVFAFDTGIDEDRSLTKLYDLRDGPVPFKNQGKGYHNPVMKMKL
jgi:N-terminal region of glycosyl transferase group 7/N-terminal domain of galactosyltransferase